MRLKGAISILMTMVAVPLLTFAANRVLVNSEKIARLEEREKSLKENVVEIKGDVKYIRNTMEKTLWNKN